MTVLFIDMLFFYVVHPHVQLTDSITTDTD